MDYDEASPTPPPRPRSAARRFLRLALPVGFLAFTIWNIVGILGEGTDPSSSAEDGGPLSRDEVTLAVSGDIGLDSAARATLTAMAVDEPDVYLVLGDLSYGGLGSEQAWCSLVREAVGPVAPVEIVGGNHEDDTGQDGHINTFARCLPDRLNAVGTYGQQYYFDLGSLARVIMLSPDLTVDGTRYFYGAGTPNLQWVVDAIDDARSAGIQWVIVGMHKNCISAGEYACDVGQDLLTTLIEKRVDLVLHGHDHTYQRSKQLAAPSVACSAVLVDNHDPGCVADDGADDVYLQGVGSVFVVAGAGGAALYDINADDAEADYFAVLMGKNRDGRNGFVRLTLTPAKLGVEFVGSSAGGFGDEFQIQAANVRMTVLSAVVVAYNMVRELPRTLRSLAPGYQRGIDPDSYEVIVVDNGSAEPVADLLAGPSSPSVEVLRVEPAPPSPARAANTGIAHARGEVVGVLIDGARIASPGLLATAVRATELAERAIVATLAWHLGPATHMEAADAGYDQAVEDSLLDEIAWEDDGYRLFSVSTLAGSSARGWFGPLGESNALFMRRDLWQELGGYDEEFSLPGGGRVNHDVFRRACALADTEVVVLLGEGTFHQIHGGAATSGRIAKADVDAEYERLRGAPFAPPQVDPLYFGRVPATALPHLMRSVRWALDAWPAGTSPPRP